jgi:uncharacterized protein YdiU (UPF0061 family)
MSILHPFTFDYSYLSLPKTFYSRVKPAVFPAPEVVLLNEKVGADLSVPPSDLVNLLGSDLPNNIHSFAQAYAGHQFGHFTMLGDGRAIVLGEHLAADQQRFDIQLKGSGRTIYSRGGDGKATLKAMLREYLISEAMHSLNIPSSRSLAVIKTGEPVYRETTNEGAALVRVMKSHIRVGTFQYAAYHGSVNDLIALTDYTIQRLFPDCQLEENPVLGLLNRVMAQQIELVSHWMRVGFIHGVMNTDNTSISGETFDYGPCAFMNTYHPDTVFSSIDQHGRYAFGNQPGIIKWNMARFAEALLPILHTDKNKSLELAQSVINGFDVKWERQYYGSMLKKIGLEYYSPELKTLVDELLDLMRRQQLDYTNTFLSLAQLNGPFNTPEFQPWLTRWKEAVENSSGMTRAHQLMQTHNPFYIPRNHWIEKALDEAVKGDMSLVFKLLELFSAPYHFHAHADEFMKAPGQEFDKQYQTFCGT